MDKTTGSAPARYVLPQSTHHSIYYSFDIPISDFYIVEYSGTGIIQSHPIVSMEKHAKAIVAHSLHNIMQIHRIAIEKKYDVKFRNTERAGFRLQNFPGINLE